MIDCVNNLTFNEKLRGVSCFNYSETFGARVSIHLSAHTFENASVKLIDCVHTVNFEWNF